MMENRNVSGRGKICFLLLHLGQGGVEQFAANLANELCKKDDVEIISVYKKFDAPVPDLDEKIRVRYIFDFDIVDKKTRPLLLVWLIWHYVTRNIIIGKRIRKIKKGVIITTRPAHNKVVGKYARDNVKKIATEHNHLLGDLKYTEKVVRSCRFVDYAVFPSKEVFDYYSRRMHGAVCVRIPHFLKNVPREQAKLDDANIISLGRLSPEKGYDDLMRVFKDVVAECPIARLTILGEGNERKNLQAIIKKYGMEKYVTMPGYMDEKGVDNELRASSVFVSTSHTEAFGLAALEAMAYGLPVVAFESARGILDFVEDGVDGIVVARRSRSVMARKILELLNDKKMRQDLGNNARKKAKQYTPAKIIPRWWDIIDG
jgi:N-acetylglucosaminyldiphosphoundecaprenol N-acetyl-beta-D-mannosaminyltransferase